MKKIIALLTILMFICSCSTKGSSNKTLSDIEYQFEYNDYQIYYYFLGSALLYKSNGNCYEQNYDYSAEKGSITSASCPIKYNGQVWSPTIYVFLSSNNENVSYISSYNDFRFTQYNIYEYSGYLNNEKDIQYKYTRAIGEEKYTIITYHDPEKNESFYYLIDGAFNTDNKYNYGTLSKTGEKNCKQFYKQYQDTLKEIGLTVNDLDSFYSLYYEEYIKPNEEKINNELQTNYSDKDCYDILVSEGYTFYKYGEKSKISENEVWVTERSEVLLICTINNNEVETAVYYPSKYLYPGWIAITDFNKDKTYLSNSDTGCVVDSFDNKPVDQTKCTQDELDEVWDAKVFSRMLYSKELSQGQVLRGILYYYNN